MMEGQGLMIAFGSARPCGHPAAPGPCIFGGPFPALAVWRSFATTLHMTLTQQACHVGFDTTKAKLERGRALRRQAHFNPYLQT